MRPMNMTSPIRTTAGALALAAAFSVALPANPLAAQEGGTSSGNPDLAEGAEMLSEGFKKLFRGLLDELEPAGDAAEQGWNDLVDWLGDLSAYEAPEQLPNGDILIRRKEPLTPGTGVTEPPVKGR